MTTTGRPIAWMRKWAADGEVPTKVKGRWPARFKFLPVTMNQCMPDDVPLCRCEVPVISNNPLERNNGTE